MRGHFGPVYADSFASDFVITELANRTVNEALAQGEPAKDVWRAVCVALDLPPSVR